MTYFVVLGHRRQISPALFPGVGRSQTKHGTFVVVNYDPPGNILYEGQFEYNVQEPQGHG